MGHTKDTLKDAASRPREGAVSATPEQRADAELNEIRSFDAQKLNGKFTSEVLEKAVMHLKDLISVAKTAVAAYNTSIDSGETAQAEQANEAIADMINAGSTMIFEMRKFFTDARQNRLNMVSLDCTLQVEVFKTFEKQMPTGLFDQLLNKLMFPVLKLQKRHLDTELNIPEPVSESEENIIAEIIMALNLFVGEADRNVRAALKEKLVAKFEAEEKAKKAERAMNGLNRQITRIQTDFLTFSLPESKDKIFATEPKGARWLILAAMRTFAAVSGLKQKEEIDSCINEILSRIRFDYALLSKYEKAVNSAAIYDTDELRNTSVGYAKLAEAAREMAEAKRELLKGVLKAVMAVFEELNLEDFFEWNLSDSNKLNEVRGEIVNVICEKLSAAITSQFVQEVSEIQVIDVDNIVKQVLAKINIRTVSVELVDDDDMVEMDVEDIDDDSDDGDNTSEEVDHLTSAIKKNVANENAADEVTSKPLDSSMWNLDGMRNMARTALSDAKTKIRGRTVSAARSSVPTRPVARNPVISPAEAVTAPASVQKVAQPVAAAVVAPAISKPNIDAPTQKILIRFEPEVPSQWPRRILVLGSFILGGGAIAVGSVGVLAAVNAFSDRIAAENGADNLRAEPAAPGIPVESIWTKLSNNTGRQIDFPASGDNAWVEAFFPAGTVPEGTNALIFECTNGAVSQTAGYPEYILPDGYWLIQDFTVKGFETFGAVQNLERMCVAHQNGVFATVLTPNPVE